MSEAIKHECGIAFIRLRKPLEYYQAKYGTPFYAINKMYLLMEKQHNRGQDGAGLACIKLDTEPGMRYINRQRSNADSPIKDIYAEVYKELGALQNEHPSLMNDVNWLKSNARFTGEVFLAHLRYGTFGGNQIANVHPFIRHNNWKTRNLVLAGNFNLTNNDEQFKNLIELGQHPIETSDTVTIMEKIGHFLDEEIEEIYLRYKALGRTKKEMTELIVQELDLVKILKNASKRWDGGYVMTGMLGHGDSFIFRDPAGIRPAYYYQDDEIIVAASERPVIQTAMNVDFEDVHELEPGHALISRTNGDFSIEEIITPTENQACSFERIYFSRGTDAEIYKERKNLGKRLANRVLQNIHHDLDNTVFSYIPNTASVAFRGLAEELDVVCNDMKRDKILALGTEANQENIDKILATRPRVEKVAIKDVKMRTFITQDKQRDDLVAHVYDITYGTINKDKDTLVILDDSIVRGTTLKQSILRILDRLGPKKIVVVSSAPQIRYPDCYGIDMAKLGDFIAYQAAIALLKDKKMDHIINETYKAAKDELEKPKEDQVNVVRAIYAPFTAEEVSDKIAEILRPADLKADFEIIYQSIEDLHLAIPKNKGDWYFTGKYPTPGGNKVVNQSFINYVEGSDKRAY